AGKDALALDLDLAVAGSPDSDAGHRLPHSADLAAARPVHRRGARGLGHAIALQHGDVRAAEEMAEPLAERRTAGDRIPHPAAGRRPHPAIHALVEACCWPLS